MRPGNRGRAVAVRSDLWSPESWQSQAIVGGYSEQPPAIVTERDLMRAVAVDAALARPVGEIASAPLVTVAADDHIHRAIGRMTAHEIRHLAVVDRIGNVVGARSASAESERQIGTGKETIVAEQIGIIGLGIMGGAFARNLAKAGFEIVGCEIDASKLEALNDIGLTRAGSPAEVAGKVDRIITSLPNAKAFAAVTGEIAAAGRPVVVADTCTLTVAEKEVGRSALENAGSILLDCPVGGTGAQAAQGDLVVFGSGDEAAFARVRPVFEQMARVVHHLGAFGAGSAMKFIHNLLVTIHDCSAAEAFAMGRKAGMDPQTIYDVISSSVGTSRIFEVRGPFMVSGDYDTNITAKLELLMKDIACIAQHARDIGCPTPLFSLASEIHRSAVAQGHAASDPAVVCKVMEQWAGVGRG